MYWICINIVITDKGAVSIFLKIDYVFIKKYMAFSMVGTQGLNINNNV